MSEVVMQDIFEFKHHEEIIIARKYIVTILRNFYLLLFRSLLEIYRAKNTCFERVILSK